MTIAAALLTITVRVYDLYGLPPAERLVAIETAGSILAQAGIEARFIECQRPLPDVCLAVLKPGEMVLRIHPDAHARHEVLGAAIISPTGGPNVMATIYGAAVYERSVTKSVRLGTLAGRVAAHEIGHLLLGKNSHSPHGLMRAHWDVRKTALDDWLFSVTDARTIRQRLVVAGELIRAVDAAPVGQLAAIVK
jgi:hypothetical protein